MWGMAPLGGRSPVVYETHLNNGPKRRPLRCQREAGPAPYDNPGFPGGNCLLRTPTNWR